MRAAGCYTAGAMSGHSKWATIKRQKGVADAKRSQVFTKLAKAVAVAARTGGGPDPDSNFKLRLAIDRARAASMPKDNIDRAIKRGVGTDGGAAIEEVLYEGYGPGGVAFLIEAVTDNRNRSSSGVRHALEKHGGRLGEAGSVAWLFETKGIIQVKPTGPLDELELALIEAGATDIREEEGDLIITCEPHSLEGIKTTLAKQNLTPTYANVEPVAKTTTAVDEHTAAKLDELRSALDEDDDITNFYDNAA